MIKYTVKTKSGVYTLYNKDLAEELYNKAQDEKELKATKIL